MNLRGKFALVLVLALGGALCGQATAVAESRLESTGVLNNLSDMKLVFQAKTDALGWKISPSLAGQPLDTGDDDRWTYYFDGAGADDTALLYDIKPFAGSAAPSYGKLVLRPGQRTCSVLKAAADRYVCTARKDEAGTVVYMFSLRNPVERTLPADQRQAQADVLNKMCVKELAQCDFRPKTSGGLIETVADRHPVGARPYNCGLQPITHQVTWSDVVTNTTTITVSAELSAQFFKMITVKVGLSFGRTLTQSHTFTQSTSTTIAPGAFAWFEFGAPMLRATGDLVVKLDNITWVLTDVAVDTPNPSGAGVLVASGRKMTSEERAEICGEETGLVLR